MRTVKISAWLLSGVVAVLLTNSCRKTALNDELIASAGKNDTIYGSKAELNGTYSSGRIAQYEWTKTSGPGTFSIDDPSAPLTVVTNLQTGTYEFKLTVTGKSGSKSSSTKRIDVANPELAFENLVWENDPIHKMQFMKVPLLPNLYSVNRIHVVYLFGGSMFSDLFPHGADWFPIGKNGTKQNEYYYKIEKDTIVVYEFYDTLPGTFPNIPLYFVTNKVKILFE